LSYHDDHDDDNINDDDDDDNIDDDHDDYVGVVDIKRKESNIYLDIRKASSSQRFEVIDRILDINIVIVMPINKSVEICVIDGNMSDDYYSMNYT
jgi:hypothetical protein